MALTRTQVSQLYVAIFNRASDGEGNRYWQTKGDLGNEMITVAAHMMATPDAQKFFGNTLYGTNKEFVTFIYKNTLGREPDKGGLDYWVSLLDKGMGKGELVAHLVTTALQNDEKAFVNKVEVSDYTASKTDKAITDDIPKYQELIKDVTKDTNSVEAAKKLVDDIATSENSGDGGITGEKSIYVWSKVMNDIDNDGAIDSKLEWKHSYENGVVNWFMKVEYPEIDYILMNQSIYDLNGNQIEWRNLSFNKDGETIIAEKTIYNYNSQGQLISYDFNSDNGNYSNMIYTWNSDGYIATGTQHLNGESKNIKEIGTELNSTGNDVLKAEYYEDDKLTSIIYNEFDSNGNQIKGIQDDNADGIIDQVLYYEWILLG